MKLFPPSWRRKIVSYIRSISTTTSLPYIPSHSSPKNTTQLMISKSFHTENFNGPGHSVVSLNSTVPSSSSASMLAGHYSASSTNNTAATSSSFSSITSSSSFPTQSHTPCSYVYNRKDHDWSLQQEHYTAMGEINVVSFNMLAPVYKRLSQVDIHTGNRKREATNATLWKERCEATIQFFQQELFPHSDIIGLQEFWLTDRHYYQYFAEQFQTYDYGMFTLQRTGDKDDAVVLLVKNTVFEILQSENVYLCSEGDRVALLLWLRHRTTGKEILVANTHLSFPHTMSDRMNQMQQMKKLTIAMDKFAQRHSVRYVTRLIMGDFNVESNSPVCDHLRNSGFYSCFEVHPPENGPVTYSSRSRKMEKAQQSERVSDEEESDHCGHAHSEDAYGDYEPNNNNSIGSCQKPLVSFVSHRNHHQEEVGVDHIFVKPATRLFPMLSTSSSHGSHYNNSSNSNNNMLHIFQNESHYPHVRPSFSRIDPVPSMGLSSPDKYFNTEHGGDGNHLLNYHAQEDVFVDHCSVIPRNMPCSSWNEEFRISDHRPVSATIIFGRKKS